MKKNRINIYVLFLIEVVSEELKIIKSFMVFVVNLIEFVRVKLNVYFWFVLYIFVIFGGRFVGRINVGWNFGS